MSLRERVLIALGAIAVAGTVIVPVAYRLNTEVLGVAAERSALPASAPIATATPVPPPAATPAAAVRSTTPALEIVAAWASMAMVHRSEIGMTFDYDCPPNGLLGAVWGTGTYTDDSSVCTAAVHDGVIRHATGGTVTIIIRPGLPSYLGTTANGVTSESYGEWEGSYEFVVP